MRDNIQVLNIEQASLYNNINNPGDHMETRMEQVRLLQHNVHLVYSEVVYLYNVVQLLLYSNNNYVEYVYVINGLDKNVLDYVDGTSSTNCNHNDYNVNINAGSDRNDDHSNMIHDMRYPLLIHYYYC